MEAFTSYSMRGYNFTIWFFRLLLLFALTTITLVFVLRINETITIRQGEIVAATPQADFKAPFEAQLVKLYVKEGQQVNAGDTLLVMRNNEYAEQAAKLKTEIEYLGKKIESFRILEIALEKRKAAINKTSAISARKYHLDIRRMVNDMKTLDEQYSFQKERLSSARERYVGDSILYKKDMLSKYEYNNTKDANLALKENLSALTSQRNKHIAEKNLVYNDFTREQNSILLTKVQLEENAQALMQTKNDYESQLLQAKETVKKIEAELSKQNIIATTSGIVNFIFNTKQSSNIINKGDLLISVAPQTISYYAKVTVPEKEMPYIKKGLAARLKLDAYHQFRSGLIKGNILYVAERKEANNFYALVQLAEPNALNLKSGYTLYGEIVLQRLPLYKYIIKKLFKKIDPNNATPKTAFLQTHHQNNAFAAWSIIDYDHCFGTTSATI